MTSDTPSIIGTDHPLSPEQQHLLGELAGMIVAPSDTYNLPGADDELIFARLLAATTTDPQSIVRGLDFALSVAGERPIHACIEQLEGRPELAALVSLVMHCYYTDDRVMRSLDMEPRPPFPAGFKVEQGDLDTLLAPVQSRGKIWRDDEL